MSEAGIIALVTALLTFTASIYGAARVSHDNRDKTIQAVKDEIRGIKEESAAKDQEMHAEIMMLGQQMESGLALVRKDITTLADRVEKHNNVIERMFKLEQKVDDMERSGK